MDEYKLNYMNSDEIADFGKRLGPKLFDPASIKNNHTDISYGPLPEHLLDIYLPESGEAPFPTLVYIHGGGWAIGDRRLCALDSVIGLLDRGWAVMSIEYRLSPKVVFPEHLFDVKAVLAWIYEHGAEYSLDRSRVALAGDSAGAHLSLMAGFTQDRNEYRGFVTGQLAEVKAVISMYGPADLGVDFKKSFSESGVKTMPPPPPGTETADFMKIAFGTDNKALLRLNSPVSLITKDSPPVLLLHGKQDAVVPYQQSEAILERMDSVCGAGRAKMIIYPDRNHSDPGFLTAENVNEVAAFLDGVFNA